MTFSILNYIILIIMFSISAIIGIYYGFIVSKQNTTTEYLFGGKTMKVFPVAMSMIASNISAISLISIPADVYLFGASYIWVTISLLLNGLICCYIVLPVFLKIHITTVYEYLQLRFDSSIRKLASFLFTLYSFLYNPIVIYLPAISFAQVTGFNVHLISFIVCAICIFYTTMGGLKAVVWTDTIQTIAIFGSIIIVMILGIISVGGFSPIWETAGQGHRLDLFNFNVDPTRRDSFWAIAIGSTGIWLSTFATSQATIQRLMAVPSITQAKKTVMVSCIGIFFVKTISIITGLIMYTKYADCDPMLSNQINKYDQLIPFYVMEVAEKTPGLPGLFIAGVFSAGISTLSTTLNTISGTIYADFISPFMVVKRSPKQESNILKLIVLICGLISTLLVLIVDKMGSVLPFILSISGVAGGPLLGLFALGMLFPGANSRGAMSGGIVSLIFCSWIVFGNQYYKGIGMLEDFSKSLTAIGCKDYVNITTRINIHPVNEPLALYRITFWYYNLLGALVVVVVGLIVSLFTKKHDAPVNPDLISPIFHFMLSKNNSCNYSAVSGTLKTATQSQEY